MATENSATTHDLNAPPQPIPPSRTGLLRKGGVRLGLAVSGALMVGGAIFLQKKRRTQPARAPFDPDVEDFTANQEALLCRVREIWDEYCARGRSAEVSGESA
jgi:hypothetical protein